jgi:SHS2 domain-containing protein
MAVEYLEHTADLGLRATGATLSEAFCEAARGLFALMVDPTTVRPLTEYAVHLEAGSNDGLLVEWLSELLAQKELTGLVFSEFEARIGRSNGGRRLDGVARGERLDPTQHRPGTEVKGISYLGLAVRQLDDGWSAQCVVDV